MARPKNTERKEKIKLTAWNLFREKGYKASSYADIAAACGLERTNVQIYFPHKKQLLDDLLEQLLDGARQIAEEEGMLGESYSGNLFVIGQLYHAFLLQDAGMCQFTEDLLSSRELTEDMIEGNLAWAKQYFQLFQQKDGGAMDENITMIMGGVYELLYRALRQGTPPKPQEIQYRTIHTFLLLQGCPEELCTQILDGKALSEETTAEAVRRLNQKIFSLTC